MLTCKIGQGILKEIKELEIDFMEHDYMRIRGHKRSHGTSRKLKVVVISQKMLFDMVKIVKKKFHVIRTCLFPFSFNNEKWSKLINDQNTNIEPYSWCIL